MSMAVNELQERLRTLPYYKGAKPARQKIAKLVKASSHNMEMLLLILNFAAVIFFSKVLGLESFIYIGLDRVFFMAMLGIIAIKAMAEKRNAPLIGDRSERLFLGYALYLAAMTFVIFCFLPNASWSTYIKEMFQLFFEYFLFFWVVKRVSSGLNIRKLYYVFALIISIEALIGVVENFLQFNFFYALIQMYGLPYNHSIDKILTWGYIRNDTLRSIGTFSQPMEFSGVLTINIPFLLYFISTAKKMKAKLLLSAALILSVWAIDASQTRTAIIIALVTIVLFMLFSTRTSKLVKLLLFLCVSITPLFWYDVISAFTGSDDVSTTTRLQNYANGLQVFYHHYLVGVGYGGFDQGEQFHIDNYFLTLMIETGAIGAAIFAFGLVWAAVHFWHHYIKTKAKVFADYYLTMALLFVSFILLNLTFDAMGIVAFGKVFLFLLAIGINFLRAKEKEAEAVEQ